MRRLSPGLTTARMTGAMLSPVGTASPAPHIAVVAPGPVVTGSSRPRAGRECV